MNDRHLSSALLLAAIAQWIAPLLPLMGLGQTVGAQARDGGIPPELPPGIFFSIWSVIFTLYLAFALYAVFRPKYVHQHLGPPLLGAGIANTAWMLSAQLIGSEWLNLALLFPVVCFSWMAARRLHLMGGWDGTGHKLVAAALTGLLAGWSVVAVSISLPRVIRMMRGLDATDQVWVSLWCALVPAGLLAWAYASKVSRGLWFFVALGWGISGIIVNNWTRTGTHWLAIMATLIGLYIFWRRLAYGARPAFE